MVIAFCVIGFCNCRDIYVIKIIGLSGVILDERLRKFSSKVSSILWLLDRLILPLLNSKFLLRILERPLVIPKLKKELIYHDAVCLAQRPSLTR